MYLALEVLGKYILPFLFSTSVPVSVSVSASVYWLKEFAVLVYQNTGQHSGSAAQQIAAGSRGITTCR